MSWNGLHYIDGKDLWTTFGIVVESGSNDFLKYPERKESASHDWMDSNGLDVDLSRPFFQSKQITLRLAMIHNSESDFWAAHAAFLAEWAQPGTRDWTVGEFQRTFQVYFKECTDWDRFGRIKNTTKVGCKFTLVVIEKDPSISGSTQIFIVDDQGRYLTT